MTPAGRLRGPGTSPDEGPRGFRERVEGQVKIGDLPILLEREFLWRDRDNEEVRGGGEEGDRR